MRKTTSIFLSCL